MIHVVWDWNGTLLDDTHACVAALNQMLRRRGIPAVSLEFFRREFAFPARNFYNRLGMTVPDSEWDALAREYYADYRAVPGIALNSEALPALREVRRRGWRQSILSALRQDLLDAEVERYSLGGYFERVVGSDNLDGAGKLAAAKSLAAELSGDELVFVGDAIHDAEVARAAGGRCVLVATGSHSPARLEALAPTELSLLAGVRRIGSWT